TACCETRRGSRRARRGRHRLGACPKPDPKNEAAIVEVMWTGRAAALALFLAAAAYPAVPRTRAKADAADPEKQISAIAQRWLRSLSLHDRVAQLIVMQCYGDFPATRSTEFRQLHHWVRDLHIGGLIALNRVEYGSVRNAQPYEMAVFLNHMQKLSRIPLLVGADLERGASMRVADFPKFPHNMAFGAAQDVEASRFEGAETAREARALGVTWVFAPDADVNNNPDNPIINMRSYGENPQQVSEHVAAYIEGAHSDPKHRVLVTVKHFPGHGDTAVDSHLGMPRITATRERMEQVELAPFRAAIAHGVDAVMAGHISVPALETENLPATVSPAILTGVLRRELAFRGITVTDAMDMQGLSQQFPPGQAAVRALEAGADVLLMPPDPEAAIRGVLAAIRSGGLTRKRIDESAMKVLMAKARLGLNRAKYADLDAIADAIDSPEAERQAQTVADRAITLVKDGQNLVPLTAPQKSCLLVLTESRYSEEGRTLIREAQRRSPGMTITKLDPAVAAGELELAAKDTANCETVVVAAFVSVARYTSNSDTLAGGFPNLMRSLLSGPRPVVLVALGSPYLLRSFPNAAGYMTSYSTVPTSEAAIVKALFGEIAIGGRLPVTIPDFAKYGDGLQRTVSKGRTTQ
ncbi:MAG: glycoside hydrolase family 3 N-terminal domain-containing protein, partial [Bryobacteraceae bacterium]